MTFGETIRTRRKECEMTLADLGKASGVKKGYLSGIERGKVAPPSHMVTCIIARVLSLDPLAMLKLAHAEKAPKQVKEWFLEKVKSGLTNGK